jgi:hypothetical protein
MMQQQDDESKDCTKQNGKIMPLAFIAFIFFHEYF